MKLILVLFLTAASAAPKSYLATDPQLAGSLIKLCESAAPKSCETIDRRNEPIVGDPAVMSGQIAIKLKDVAAKFHTLTVDFVKSDKVPNSVDLQFRFTQDLKKKPVKE
jgi:hypothetical protein